MNNKHSSTAVTLPPVALIAGPTASGKSALALKLAEMSGGVIINADASQLYADLRILSARPSAEDEAHAPHRLFGILDGATPCSAAHWAELAKQEIAAAHVAGHLPILVGGTGLYIRTLLDGIAPIPAIDPDVREAVRALPVEQARHALVEADPAAAARLKPTDTQRIARALEVVRSTGMPIGDWQRRKEGGIGQSVKLSPFILLPPREWLYARAESRLAAMIEQGAIEEVDRLIARKLDPTLPVMRAIGVREIAACRAGEIDRITMQTAVSAATRQYAKRQYTWFANQGGPVWKRDFMELDDSRTTELAIKLHNMSLTR